MALTVTAPDPMNGAALRRELAVAGITQVDGRDDVVLSGNQLTFIPLDESHRSTVEQVIAAHVGAPEPFVANEATIRQRAAQALDTNATYLALNNPSNAQNVAHLKTVTRECNALIRLVLGLLDDVTGTA